MIESIIYWTITTQLIEKFVNKFLTTIKKQKLFENFFNSFCFFVYAFLTILFLISFFIKLYNAANIAVMLNTVIAP